MDDNDSTEAVSRILTAWNPLGTAANDVPDLDGYRTEAADIIFESKLHRITRASVQRAIREVLYQAFGLSLTNEQCSESAAEIYAVLRD